VNYSWKDEQDADIIGSKPVPKPLDFGLFAPERPDTRPTPIRAVTSLAAHWNGLGRTQTKKATILQAIRSSGSRGITRRELSESTAICKDSVNGRASELLAGNLVHERGVRDGEKILFASAVELLCRP
jgi:hypothetical protein